MEPEALELAVAASGGFPFMMKLVGYRIWEVNPEREMISVEDAHEGIREANREMMERIIDATYKSLSNGDRRFLLAMLQDDKESNIADIASRLGKSTAYATQYKMRLMEQGVIGERGRGKVGFDIPLMREYIQSQRSE